MVTPTVHIIGGGLAGLSAGVALCNAGQSVRLYEAAGQAGGRCRSFLDRTLGEEIDNGNHMVLGANKETLALLKTIGSDHFMCTPERVIYPFIDVKTGERWELNEDTIFVSKGDYSHKEFDHYVAELKTAFLGHELGISECLQSCPLLYETLWRPFALSMINTSSEEAAARLFWPLLHEVFETGYEAIRPYYPQQSWGRSLIDPAVAFIRQHGGAVDYQVRLKELTFSDDKVLALVFTDRIVDLHEGDQVIIATPPQVLHQLLPDMDVPLESNAVLSVHFLLPPDNDTVVSQMLFPEHDLADRGWRDLLASNNASQPFIGILNGSAQWLFFREKIISTTTHIANELVKKDDRELADLMWYDVKQVMKLDVDSIPVHQIIKEKRATFACTPQALDHRPGSETSYANLYIAGDYIDTGLPPTIESAVISGKMAAQHCLAGEGAANAA